MAKNRETRRSESAKAKATQTYIDGTEPPRVKEIDEKAEEYRNVRDERMRLGQEEKLLKEQLLELMREHNLEYYPIPDTEREVVRTRGEESVTVRKRTPNKNSE